MMTRILDPCCGSRMFWFDKNNLDCTYGDIRFEKHILCDGRQLIVAPDVMLDFSNLPFENGAFHLIVFDPPHLNKVGSKGWQGLKYGKLPIDWENLLRKGFAECFRVLSSNGVLIFKWNETQIPLRSVLRLTQVRPLFGHTTSVGMKTHWVTFMKSELDVSFEQAIKIAESL